MNRNSCPSWYGATSPARMVTFIVAPETMSILFVSIMGGICILFFVSQPIGFSGTLLQLIVSVVTLISGSHPYHTGQFQSVGVTTISVMIFTVMLGTGAGRIMRLRPRLHTLALVVLPSFAVAGYVGVAYVLYMQLGISLLSRVTLVSLFCFSSGLMWGLSHTEHGTTALTHLIKACALSVKGIVSLLLFLATTGGTVFLLLNLGKSPSIGLLIGVSLLGVLLIFSSLTTAMNHLQKENTLLRDPEKPSLTLACVGFIATMACAAYTGDAMGGLSLPFAQQHFQQPSFAGKMIRC